MRVLIHQPHAGVLGGMSYSVQEGLEASRVKVETMTAIAEKFPNAYLGDLPNGERVWMSDQGVEPDDFLIAATKNGDPYLCPFVHVKGGAVFCDLGRACHATAFFQELAKRKPELHKALVAAMKAY
jgi:hypothetical protein